MIALQVEPAGRVADLAPLPSLEVALELYGAEVYRYLRRLSPTAEDAADLHQDTFLRALRAWSSLSHGANVRAWLFRIAGNLARDAHRHRVVRAAVDERAGSDSSPGPDGTRASFGPTDDRPGPQDTILTAELRDHVRTVLLDLGSRQRIAVVARVFEGLDYAAIAELLGCSEMTARQHVSQGLRRLRRGLAPYLETPA